MVCAAGKKDKVKNKSKKQEDPEAESLSAQGPTISLKDTLPLSLHFHPNNDILALSTITGQVHCYEYTDASTKRLFASKHHKDSVRCVRFNADGSHLYSASTDKSIQVMDMTTKQIVLKKSKAHDDPINILLPLTESLIASGSDTGDVRVWDLRSKSVVQEWHEHESDLVTDLHWVPHKKTIVSVGADGYLAVYDIRKSNIIARSDNMETELQCLTPLHGGSRVVVGQGDGALSIWKWGWWGDMMDRFPGHPGSVDAIVPLGEDVVATGSSDGIVRICSVLPNKLLGVIGHHEEFPIENLAVDRNRRWLASSSHDATVKFLGLGFMDDCDGSDEEQAPVDDNGEEAAGGIPSDDSWESVDEFEDVDETEGTNMSESPKERKGPFAPPPQTDSESQDEEHDTKLDHATVFVASDDEGAAAAADTDGSDDDGGSAKSRKRKKKRQKQAEVFAAKKPKKAKVEESFFSGL
ncbi:WD40-repeat-containing domain protein [Catenaria anguillulae PL171]|uniref:WD repeat-containing protein JIP5 n=1 Tax=Catenaria anguillulae PL171 TaxID=765915 RepID=A0A1Y2I5I6_9FUNG|nr:WD40-repeat-containing domain protein [Catenaria anguillulae PL171]